MAKETYKVTAPKVDKEAEVEFDFGDSLEQSTDLFGADVVFGLFKSQAAVRLQAGVRSCLEKGVDPVAWAAGWKPGAKAPSINANPVAAANAAISRMSDEEKAALLAQLAEG